ncbi:MAG: NADPH dehydrogenase NamA [Peptostreptococcales bacterium]
MANLFSSLSIKDLTLRNRIVMAPMCMYCADTHGYPTDFHTTHYESRAIGGAGLILLEATAIAPNGRISPHDLGIWDDSHIDGLAAIVSKAKKHGAMMGIQLGHAGRKSSLLDLDVIAPSSLHFDSSDPAYKTPREMTKEDIHEVLSSFTSAARRALMAGFDTIEIHGAHGYLINEFLSPLTNHRSDEYGGTLENRSRLLLEIIRSIRSVWPDEKPILLRVSAFEYSEKGNTPEDVAQIINWVKDAGIDMVDVSSGGVILSSVPVYEGYQIKMAEIIKAQTHLPTIAGGKIIQPAMANEIIANDRSDLVFLGRQFLINPYWPLQASRTLGTEIDYWPIPYERGK